jgi:hypothetical protein
MAVQGNYLNLGNVGESNETLSMSPSDRARHLYAVGATRTGKSKFLESLILQDILAWYQTQCGVLLLDWHGTLCENLIQFAASENIRDVPIVPFELRRQDWCISYNLLRKRGLADPAVVVNSFVRAMLHAWGQTNTGDTPRLGKWLRTILFTLYDGNYTLAESKQLIADPIIRRRMTAKVEDLVAQMVWKTAPTKEDAFQEMVESAVNRLTKFLSTQVMRACLCQSHVSLDLSNALDQGSVILVSLSRQDATFDEEDAATFGSLILSDLWTSAQMRGKGEEEDVKPYYVFIDEFQEFLTPTMAKTLDQASGFGLHFTLAHQFPSQLFRKHGDRAVFDSVMVNARSKVVFQLEHPDDLQTLALMQFRHHVNLDEIKYQGSTKKVVDYELRYLPGWSESETDAEGTSSSRSRSESDMAGGSHSRGIAQTEGAGTNRSLGLTTGESFRESESSGGMDLALDATFGLVFGGAEPQKTLSTSTTEQLGDSTSSADTETFTDTEAWARTETVGESEGVSNSRAIMKGKSLNPMLWPVMGQEPLPPIYRSIEEQIFRATQLLAGLPDRHCVVRLVGEKRAVHMVTTTMRAPPTTPEWTAAWLDATLKNLGFAVPMSDALRRIKERHEQLAASTVRIAVADEPATARRKISRKGDIT